MFWEIRALRFRSLRQVSLYQNFPEPEYAHCDSPRRWSNGKFCSFTKPRSTLLKENLIIYYDMLVFNSVQFGKWPSSPISSFHGLINWDTGNLNASVKATQKVNKGPGLIPRGPDDSCQDTPSPVSFHLTSVLFLQSSTLIKRGKKVLNLSFILILLNGSTEKPLTETKLQNGLPPSAVLENWDIFGNVGNDSTVIMLNNIFQPSSATLMFFSEVQLHASTACRHRQRSKYLIWDHLYKK